GLLITLRRIDPGMQGNDSIYRCPITGLKIQGLFAEEVPPENANTYEPVSCLACTRVHLVNRYFGVNPLGQSDAVLHGFLRRVPTRRSVSGWWYTSPAP